MARAKKKLGLDVGDILTMKAQAPKGKPPVIYQARTEDVNRRTLTIREYEILRVNFSSFRIRRTDTREEFTAGHYRARFWARTPKDAVRLWVGFAEDDLKRATKALRAAQKNLDRKKRLAAALAAKK